jgi:hypothetical protein
MSLINWINARIKKLNFWDIGFIKLSVAGFVLMIAKLWEPLISLDWYWYALVFVLAAIIPMLKIFKR